MKLSVIIVSYNVKYFLEQCLHSVQKASGSLDAEVIVIDNNSTDGSIDYLLPDFPNVIFIRNDHNLGFGKANNLAVKSARGEFVLFLNPDTLLPEDALTRSIQFMESRPTAGALGIRMIDGSGCFLPESKRSFPTTASAFYKLMGLLGLFPSSKKFNKYSLTYLDEHADHSVEVLSGAYMMVRKSILDKIGGFDEAFFMYGEDIDLSYRIKQAGFENWYFAGSTIIHFKGESTKKESFKYVQMFYKAMIVFVNKHYKGNGAWITRSVLKTGIGLRGMTSWMFGRSAPSKPVDQDKISIIIGSEEEATECKRILPASGNNIDEPHCIELYDEASLTSALNKFTQSVNIIFCIGQLSYGAAINTIQKLKGYFHYRFHAKGSNSIVGSDSKESVGNTIATH